MTDRRSGRIVRIRLKGFMTYDELELKPAKGLNLIIGLNGSGKSSIMAAICLGLGGKPQFTGRSVQLQDFIKYNHCKATIEIELESLHGSNDEICRVLQPDKPLWYLNKKMVNHAQITAVIKKYNIDTGNLCQFLPQEKVAEFSKMDKKQRLVNMIQAIGDQSLVTLFEELKTLRTDFCRLEANLEELENNKVSEEKMNEMLKPEIDKQDLRIKLEHELKVRTFQKMAYLYQIFTSNCREAKLRKKQLVRDQSATELELNAMNDEKACLSAEFGKYRSKVGELNTKISRCMQSLNKNSEKLGECHEEIDNAKITFKNRMMEKEEQLNKLTYLKRQIEGVKAVLIQNKDAEAQYKVRLHENAKKYENVKLQLSSLHSQIEKKKLEWNALEHKKSSKKMEIDKISNEENKKYEVLRQKYPDTYAALNWLKNNGDTFRAPVSFPALISINVKNYEDCKFIENTIATRDLLMFVCEDKGDLERFVRIMKHDKKLSVNVAMVPDESLQNFSSPSVTDEMRKVGIKCYLKDLFKAPDPVMRYLCKLNNIHKVPVCYQRAENNIDAILNVTNLFFTESERISGKRSRYGQQSMSVKRDFLLARNILPNTTDNSAALWSAKSELQEIEKSLNEIKIHYDTLDQQRVTLERQQEQLRQEKSNINSEMRKLDDLKMKYAQLAASHKRKESELVNEEEEKAKLINAICTLNAKKIEIFSEMHKATKEILLSKKEKAQLLLLMNHYSNMISSKAKEISTIRNKLTELESRFSAVDNELTRLKEVGINKYKELEEYKKEHHLEGMVPVDDLEEVNQRITNIEAQLELTNEDIAPIMAEFKERQQTILSYEEKINELKTNVENLKMNISKKKESWLPALQTHIESVNVKFSKYYKILKCAGEISLDQTDDTDDFPNYGLQIKLKYRVDEELMELSQTHHSGGECSVAAIIFILSLQGLTDVPFRCIDEINQGMDAINERKIYQLIADAAKSEACSQYFLLTPKLLMDLSYHQDVAVHTIFNSPFLQDKLNVREHLRIAKSCRQ